MASHISKVIFGYVFLREPFRSLQHGRSSTVSDMVPDLLFMKVAAGGQNPKWFLGLISNLF